MDEDKEAEVVMWFSWGYLDSNGKEWDLNKQFMFPNTWSFHCCTFISVW